MEMANSQQGSKPQSTQNASSNDSDNAKRLKILTALSDLFNRALSAETLAMMHSAITDISPDDLQKAANVAIMRCKYMPTVAELREYVGCAPYRAQDEQEASALAALVALKAWLDLYARYFENHGFVLVSYAREWESAMKPLDPRTARAIEAAGGERRCMEAWHNARNVATGSSEKWEWFARDFRKAYLLDRIIQAEMRKLESASDQKSLGTGGVRRDQLN